MPKIIDPKVEGLILGLSKGGYSYRSIIAKLKEENITVSIKFVSNVINNVGKKREAKAAGLPSPKKAQPRRVLTPSVLRKLKILTSAENPPSHRDMARTVKVSRTSVQNGIKLLGKTIRRKTRVHKLLPTHMANRKTNCRKLYERAVAGNKWKYTVTLDEAMFGLHNCNGKRKICYIRKGGDVPENWYVDKDNFVSTVMVVGAISGRGTLPLIMVPKKCKVNAEFYINKVLKPLLEVHLPKLYPGELSKVYVHHDKASSHTARKTEAYAAELKSKLGITVIQNKDIPVKAPDASPLDFFGFGYLKRRLFKRTPKTKQGLWKILKQEWSKIDQKLLAKTFNSWKRRLRLVVRKSGHHIENTKCIHRRLSQLY